jgi:hypothetical protein
VAATEFFGGDIRAAQTRFGAALELLEGLSEADRDRVIHSTILANLGTVAETSARTTVRIAAAGVAEGILLVGCAAAAGPPQGELNGGPGRWAACRWPPTCCDTAAGKAKR